MGNKATHVQRVMEEEEEKQQECPRTYMSSPPMPMQVPPSQPSHEEEAASTLQRQQQHQPSTKSVQTAIEEVHRRMNMPNTKVQQRGDDQQALYHLDHPETHEVQEYGYSASVTTAAAQTPAPTRFPPPPPTAPAEPRPLRHLEEVDEKKATQTTSTAAYIHPHDAPFQKNTVTPFRFALFVDSSTPRASVIRAVNYIALAAASTTTLIRTTVTTTTKHKHTASAGAEDDEHGLLSPNHPQTTLFLVHCVSLILPGPFRTELLASDANERIKKGGDAVLAFFGQKIKEHIDHIKKKQHQRRREEGEEGQNGLTLKQLAAVRVIPILLTTCVRSSAEVACDFMRQKGITLAALGKANHRKPTLHEFWKGSFCKAFCRHVSADVLLLDSRG